MTLYEFNQLSLTDKAEAVWNGVLLSGRDDGIYKILLYQIDGFYVEVYYHPINNAIERLRSFSSTNQLEPYLERIKIKM